MKQFDVFAADNVLYYNSYFPAADKQVIFEDSTRRQPLLWAGYFERMGCQKVTQYLKAALQLGLFVVFFAFFGLPAVKKFQREETIAVYSSKQTSGIEAPAVTFSVFSNGWKSAHLYKSTTASQFWISEYCDNVDEIEQCIKSNTYDLENLIIGHTF